MTVIGSERFKNVFTLSALRIINIFVESVYWLRIVMVPALGDTTLTNRQCVFQDIIPYDLIWIRTLTAVMGSQLLPKLWHDLCTHLGEVLINIIFP
jgi:hypothetical protein